MFQLKVKNSIIMIPQEPGYYLWYILDLGYFKVGAVHILEDTAEHLEWLKTERKNSKTHYIYQNDTGKTLTLYHMAHDHLPFVYDDGKPNVDGYITFDWGLVQFR